MKQYLSLLLAFLVFVATAVVPGDALAESQEESRWLDVEVGQSLIWRGEKSILRVLVSDPSVAEVKLLEQEQAQIRGLQVGSTDFWIWFRDEPARPVSYEIVVHQDLTEMVRRVGSVVKGTPPRVYPMRGHIAVEGPVDDVETLERVAGIAMAFDKEFVNLMTVRGDHQVQLHVVFAEVSRSGMRELGLNALAWGTSFTAGVYGPNKGDSFTAERTINGVDDEIVWPFPTVGAFQLLGLYALDDVILGGFLGVMEGNDLSKILAEPTLVALSGQEAEFLAGGEVPMALSTNNQVAIQFKEYGIKLVFVPTVLAGNVIDLRVYTEVSDLDPSTSVQAGGITVPGFLKRKGSSHLRIENGKTFAMAGLLSESSEMTKGEIPVLGRIPLVGALFRYTRHERQESEIMIFVTPRLVRPLADNEVPALPTASEDNNPNDLEFFLLGLDHRSGSRNDQTAGPVGMER